ncbi:MULTISPECIES: glycosyltransferase family 25 protein [unclassified Mesorhizobium]|uniref:glycosyltransferase family 25 protein n=1 Tax=unclassified Mesorhizobium TaxID=325217 RepID=UPI00067EF354|nr:MULTISPECIES: glycosyltransferase family 25 protein [unclassified Mesorhizobium]WJI80832.1 glycosyltransferase family 25 protein [Mesorhizobium sp. C374B]WJI87371.1 glycosyltransferase family 25 protein [Mesorhizobium sp. C372A]
MVINLDRSTDRLVNITSEFARIGVSFQRIAAVDARSDPVNFPALPHLTKPEIACFLSHRKCWQIIAGGADEYAAIFEDDAVLTNDGGQLFSNDQWVPRDADIVKLETMFGRVRLGRIVSVSNGHAVGRLVGEHLGTAGYVISKGTAQRLLHQLKHLKEPIDLTLFSPNSWTFAISKIYQLVPAMCVQSQRLVGKKAVITLIQAAPHRPKNVATKIRGELLRFFAHCRNGTFWGTEKVDLRWEGEREPAKWSK